MTEPLAPTTIGERQAIAVSAIDAFEIGYGFAMGLRGQTLEDSRAVGRFLGSDLFADIADQIRAAEKALGFDPFTDSDNGIVQAKAIIHAALATPTTNAPVADREALQHKLRMVVSHATGGSSQDIDASVNDICVEITRVRNMVWEGGRQSALRDAAKAQATLPIHGEMREALEQREPHRMSDETRRKIRSIARRNGPMFD